MTGAVPLLRADAERAEGAARDESEAQLFERFYLETRPALRGYLAAATRDGALADELTQEAFVRLFAAGREFDGELHRRRYLFRIAANLLADHRRGQAREWAAARMAGSTDDPELLPAPAGVDAVEIHDLERAFAAAPERDRELVWLAHVEQRSHLEIAELLGVGAASVRVLLHRARRRLAAALRGGSLQGAER